MPTLYRLTCFITNLCNNRKTIWPNNHKTRRNRPLTLVWVNPAHSTRVRTCILLIRRPRAKVELIMERKSIWQIWVNRLLAICTLTYRTSSSNKKWPSTSRPRRPQVKCNPANFKALPPIRRISKFYTRIRFYLRFPKVLLGPSCLKTRSLTRVSKINIMDPRKY